MDRVADGLEGVERDTEGQDDPNTQAFEGRHVVPGRRAKKRDVVVEEVGVLECEQKS
jgi:hypothetical protein